MGAGQLASAHCYVGGSAVYFARSDCTILAIRFWSNGLYGTHFEINSCWQGVSAVGAGIVTVVGLAKAAWTKYGLDSKYNSPEGQKPNMTTSLIKIGEDKNERRN